MRQAIRCVRRRRILVSVDSERAGPAAHAITCPACGSSDWKRARIVYEEGRATTSGRDVGFGVGAGEAGDLTALGGGLQVRNKSGEYQTELSRRAAPPQAKALPTVRAPIPGPAKIGIFCLCSAIALGLLGAPAEWSMAGVLGYLVFGGIALPETMRNSKWVKEQKALARQNSEKEYKEQLALYERKRMCLRCGEFYVGSSDSKSGVPGQA
jgi:hypothetical protein